MLEVMLEMQPCPAIGCACADNREFRDDGWDQRAHGGLNHNVRKELP